MKSASMICMIWKNWLPGCTDGRTVQPRKGQ